MIGQIISLALAVSAAPTTQQFASVPIYRKKFEGLSPADHAKIGILHTMNKFAAKGSVAMVNGQNQLYVTPVTIGKGQLLQLDLDTGSADTWVRGKGCTSGDGSCDPKFATVDSTDKTLVDTGKQYSVSYGSGSVNGNIYKAPVEIAGFKATIPIGISKTETGFNDGYESGLMGMGYDSISTISQTVGSSASFFDGLKLTGNSNRFSFYLSNSPDAGEFTIGGSNPAHYTGAFTTVPLNSETYFQFDLSTWTYSINGKTGPLGGSGGGLGGILGGGANAIADTGTTLLLFNDATVSDGINAGLGAGAYNTTSQVYVVDCGLATTGPSLTLSYGSIPFVIPASVLVMDNGGVSQFTQFGAPNIFGDTFMRAYYTVFDKTNNAVMFAKIKK